MNVGESASFEVDMDAALSATYDKVMAPASSEDIEKTESVTEPVEAAEENKITDTGNETEDKPAEAQPLSPHPRWSADEKAAFATLPREAQEFVLKREGDVEKNLTQKTQEIAEQRKQYESLEQVLAPRRQELAAMGGEAHVLNQLLQLNDFANRDPAGFIQWLAKDRNIDLGNFAKPAEEEFIDPALQAYKQRVDSIEQKLTQKEHQEEVARKTAINNEITQFSQEKDDKGSLLRPHFDAVRSEMSAMFKSGLVNDLKEAYDRACYANPTIRQKIFDEQKKADEVARLNAGKEAAAKAAKAAGVQVKTKVPATPGKAKGSWEDGLEDIYDRVVGA